MFSDVAAPPAPFGLSLPKPPEPQLPIILSLSKDGLRMHGHFDTLSANGRFFGSQFP
jgi:hypothetical protein